MFCEVISIKGNRKKILAVLIIFIIIATGLSYFIYYGPKESKRKEKEEVRTVDDRISPYTNQGITVEILRIRHRGLMDKMLKFGISWRKAPSFYWITTVDGKESNSFGTIVKNGVFNDWYTMLWE